jgi:hypothetical protein
VLVFDWFLVVRSQPLSLAKKRFDLFPQAVITMLVLVLVGSLFMHYPMTLSRWVGAPIILLLAVAFWTSACCLVALLVIRRTTRTRLLAVAGGVAGIALLVTGPYNEAKIRTISESDSPGLATSVGDYFDKWLDARRSEIEATPGPYRVVIVAAEGGGIRAAYWTGGILTRLQDHPAWGAHILALSGVSGGAVGTGVFAGLIAASHAGKVACQDRVGALYPCAKRIFSADLLSPPLLYMLMNDGLRSIFRRSGADERTGALEQALEEAFVSATGSTILSGALTDPWRQGDPRELPPLVVSNMTVAGRGERAVLAAMKNGGAFKDATDVTDYVRPERLRISTAIVLSARFPLISATAVIDDETKVLRLVDGGYADNSGAATAIDLVQALLEAAARKGLRERIAPVVLPIKNGEAQSAAARSPIQQSLIGGIIDPLATLNGVRAASSARYESELAKYMATVGGVIVKGFELKYGEDRYPLGWTLGTHTIQLLDAQIAQLLGGAPGAAFGALFAQP